MPAAVTRAAGGTASLLAEAGSGLSGDRFIKIGHLTVNRVLDFHDDYRAISSAAD
jgi:hypothetical protein